ncbi:ATP synthase F1 subunit delta [Bartonella ancashensis]|uniref:ATP synthase subunit delta n=1 Tax=Bartonella ancashensis TaxID=1318743 RepID=A0A0M3T2N6_9HYPH|nr:ATP synthase F1 subunit delta [Bartonella ancashensis]ALE03161.1 ATP synthase delta chain [Bartonella ancashensis]
MSDSFSFLSLPLVSQRYADALFGLVREAGCVDDVEKILVSFHAVLDQNEALKLFLKNPFFSAKEQVGVFTSICKNMGVANEGAGKIVRNFLHVVAVNRRLSALSGILHAFRRRVASFRKEVSVQVISARQLDVHQKEKLCTTLENILGGKVILQSVIDPTILGGLVVRFGSYQVDASLITKLLSLKLALKKEVS